MGSDRRRDPRLSLVHDVDGELVRVSEPFTILDIGAGGFSASSPMALPLGVERLFEFVVGNVAVTLPANAVRRQRDPSGPTASIIGFSFAEQAANRERIELLMRVISNAVAVDSPVSHWIM